MIEKQETKDTVRALIARYRNLNLIIAIAGGLIAIVLITVIVIVISTNLKGDTLPVNAVYDDGGHLTGITGDPTVCIDPGHGYDDPGADSDFLGKDTAEREITKGSVCAPRFSPGYADLPLEVGREIVKRLGADVRLGIGFTESGLMIPRKSVSAIVCVRDKIGDTEDEKYT